MTGLPVGVRSLGWCACVALTAALPHGVWADLIATAPGDALGLATVSAAPGGSPPVTSSILADPPPLPTPGFTIGRNWTATTFNTQLSSFGTGSIPPDTMGGIGPNDAVELINSTFGHYDKDGVLQTRTTLNAFWNTAFVNAGTATVTSSSFDPRIIYDANSSRWFASAVDGAGTASSRILVGVTTGSDPSPANWRGFTLGADADGSHWGDFPMMGINGDGLFITLNMVANSSGMINQVNVHAIPKASLTGVTPSVSGAALQETVNTAVVPNQFDVNDIGFSPQPAFDYDNGSLPLPMLSSFNSSFVKRTDIPVSFFSGTSIADQTGANFISSAQPAPPLANQPGPEPDNVQTNDTRFSGNVILQNGSLWAVQTIDVSGRAAVKWYEIDQATNGLLQSGTITDPSLDFYFPSIAVNDNGDVVIGMSGSDDSTPISTYVTVGETTAGTTTFMAPTQTHGGTGSYEILDGIGRNRWGDYSATVIDPTDQNVFWTIQEYSELDTQFSFTGNWAIRFTEILIPEPGTFAVMMAGVILVTGRPRRRRAA